MLERANETSPRNYSRDDESARRLWLTQRLRANPWEGRKSKDEDDLARARGEVGPAEGRPVAAVIAQGDKLSLDAKGESTSDPFFALIERRLLTDHE
ncbi:MAG: hypothetical protein VKP62_02505 [Candidatus Sericytochromatia bacterium]|nr:hypothetical protein [Candidatus Sericytochromatia bacterium]